MYIREGGVRTSNLYRIAFAFVALQADTRQAAERVRQLALGKLRITSSGRTCTMLIGGAFAVDGLRFSGNAFGRDQHFKILRLDPNFGSTLAV